MDKKDYIFGLRPVKEAIEAGKVIDKILVRYDLNGDLAKEMLTLARKAGVMVQRVPGEKLNRITMKNHQGAIALVAPVEYQQLDMLLPGLYEEGIVPFILVLDGITDTRNFGAIARTAECAAVDAIVIPERGSVSVTPDAVRTSAGALLRIPVCREKSIKDAVALLQNHGISVVGATEKTENRYTTADFTQPVAIVMGAEDTGLSPEVMRRCDVLASIPLMGDIGSLNVSVAAGVMMYEAVRQRLAANNFVD